MSTSGWCAAAADRNACENASGEPGRPRRGRGPDTAGGFLVENGTIVLDGSLRGQLGRSGGHWTKDRCQEEDARRASLQPSAGASAITSAGWMLTA